MARGAFPIFDCDLHVVEPPDLWQEHIEPAFRSVAPVGLCEYPADLRIRVGEKVRPRNSLIRPPADRGDAFYVKRERRFGEAHRRRWNADVQLEAMDEEGVDLAVLFPSRALWVIADDGMDPGFAAAIARAYNNWLAGFCRAAPHRLYGAGLLSVHDVRDAVDEATRVVRELGFKAVFIRPNPVRGRNWHDPYYAPLWKTLEALNVAVGFHDSYGPDLPQTGDRFRDDARLIHTVCHPLEMMLCATSMIGGGVLQRHPKLRVGFLEANCGWVPLLLWRLDEHFETGTGYSMFYDDLSMKPSEYFKRQCFVSVECDEDFVKQVVEYIGDDNIMFSNDWPHLDSKFPEATAHFLRLPIPEESKRKILWDNCVRFYDMQAEAGRAVHARNRRAT